MLGRDKSFLFLRSVQTEFGVVHLIQWLTQVILLVNKEAGKENDHYVASSVENSNKTNNVLTPSYACIVWAIQINLLLLLL
jgi:hypothetical protein